MPRDTTDDIERIDEDENAETGDTRIRIEPGEHGTYEIVREKYSLVEFPGPSDDIEHERYDWHRDESFVLRSVEEAEQVAGMLEDSGAFDANVLFFRQRRHPEHYDDEELARLAHRLWSYWSMAIAEQEDISQDRLDRWAELWVPYEELSEESKDTDRQLVERFTEEEPEYESE
jgi:hypothetical protein